MDWLKVALRLRDGSSSYMQDYLKMIKANPAEARVYVTVSILLQEIAVSLEAGMPDKPKD